MHGYEVMPDERRHLLENRDTHASILAGIAKRAQNMVEQRAIIEHPNTNDAVLAELVQHFDLTQILQHKKTGRLTLAAAAKFCTSPADLRSIFAHAHANSLVLFASRNSLAKLVEHPEYPQLVEQIKGHQHVDDRMLAVLVEQSKTRDEANALFYELRARSLTLAAIKHKFPHQNLSFLDVILAGAQAFEKSNITKNTARRPKYQ